MLWGATSKVVWERLSDDAASHQETLSRLYLSVGLLAPNSIRYRRSTRLHRASGAKDVPGQISACLDVGLMSGGDCCDEMLRTRDQTHRIVIVLDHLSRLM